MDSNFSHWEGPLQVWKSGQVGLPEVVRWSKYHNKQDSTVRLQNSLQHSYSIVLLGQIFIKMMRPYCILDEPLLITALHIHDHGEGELKLDTLYIDKNEDGDLAEYSAFRERYESLGSELFEGFHEAFLLQFALKNPACFPADARDIMKYLSTRYTAECYAFDAIERWDYMMYAIEQYQEHGNEKILVQVMRNNISHLDRLADEDLEGFGQVVWTPEARDWYANFLATHDGKWIEQKGER